MRRQFVVQTLCPCVRGSERDHVRRHDRCVNTQVRELHRSLTMLTPRLGEGSRMPDGATKLLAALAIAGEGALALIGASLNTTLHKCSLSAAVPAPEDSQRKP